MKNKVFKYLSLEEKQNLLMRILRDRTGGLLKANEEAAILAAISLKQQFRIRVYHDVNEFRKDIEFSKGLNGDVAVGSLFVEDLARGNTFVDNVIAIIRRSRDDPSGMNQVYIYIPQSRICKCDCVREKFICEHLTNGNDGKSLYCDLHTVGA